MQIEVLCTSVHMSTTLTIRMDEALRRALEERARDRGVTVSEAAREILGRALDDRPMEARTGHLRGALTLGHDGGEDWRAKLRARNWRR